MATETIQLGDRVINLQVPGIFTVIDRQGHMLAIQSPKGLRMTVLDSQLRRVDALAVPPASDG
jgi:hypothetical protein